MMYLAIDIGATKTLIALFSKRGRILRRAKFRTAQGSKTFINDLSRNLEPFLKHEIKSVIVAVPGVVQKNYTVHFGNRNWGDFDIVTPIKTLCGCPVYIENDANLAAIFEAYRIPGRTVFLTFSTGLGGGVIEKNRLIEKDFEPGHVKYKYGGKTLEWEDIAAASALEKFYHADYATDLRGKKIMEDVAARMYLGIPDIVKKFHPDTIIFGGPMGKIFRLYSKYLPETPGVKYRRPKRPNESVVYGCYILARQKERE